MKRHVSKLAAPLFGTALLLFGFLWQDPGEIADVRDLIRILSNAALLPGFLLTGTGVLVLIAGDHFFDGIKYAAGSLIAHLRGTPRTYRSYYDYIHRPQKEGCASSLILPGLFFLAAAVILTLLYYV